MFAVCLPGKLSMVGVVEQFRASIPIHAWMSTGPWMLICTSFTPFRPQLEEMAGARGTNKVAGPTRALSDSCRVLADIAEPPNMKQAFDASLSVVLLQSQLGMLESATGWNLMARDRSGNAQAITLTGWTAVAGMAALVVLIMWGAAFAWRRYRGVPDKDYTLVVKKGTHH